ncbi:hypothetical protein F4809DRAFT_625376 [Biscogniauxia mediterranea]|nr:hypothetical protein F4809DRAFT_625376 [Biscogniauxia mediterranea]
MSMSQPSPEQDAPDTSLSQPGKPPRVLACVLCQQRKVRCDRKFPCANCVRSRVQCMPATLAPRRRRRAFPERELLARVRHYESLLRQNNVNFEPLRNDPNGEDVSPQQAESPANESDKEWPDSVSASRSSASNIASPGIIHEAKNFWQAIKQEIHDDDDTNECLSEEYIKEAFDLASSDRDHLLFGVRNFAVDLSTLHPDPVQILRLWQIYLDNVNPLLKVTHTPSLQRCIIEAAGNIPTVKPELEALMFSIYCISVSTLTTDDCQAMFYHSKEDLITTFHFGCHQALQNCRFLQTSDRDVLTAFFLYLISIGPKTNPRSMSSMFGIAIRIAERIGIHDETICAKESVLEAEMRRRLWWSLKLFDVRIGELADYKSASLGTAWDCHIPLNINDSDLCPETTRPPEAQSTPTEALFVVVRSMLGDLIRRSRFHLDFIIPASRHAIHSQSDHVGEQLVVIEKRIEEEYFQHCDPDNSLHFMTMWTLRGHLARCHLVEYYSEHLGSPIEQTDKQRDTSIFYALRMLECDTKVMTSPLTKGYIWISQFYFPFLAYVHVTNELRRRPLCGVANRAWEVMSDNYEARLTHRSNKKNPIYDMFSKTVLGAWEACETITAQKGKSQPVPRMVSDIKLRREQNEILMQTTCVKEPRGGLQMDAVMYNAPAPVSMPTRPSELGLTPQMDIRDSCAAVGLDPYLQSPGRSPLDDSAYQLDWASLNWTSYSWPGL